MKPIISLAVIGSRDFNDYKFLQDSILKFEEENGCDIIEIVSGGAPGADTLAEKFADENNLRKRIFPADWERFGKQAGYLRNVDIVNHADHILAFWDQQSPGTKHSIDLAHAWKKPVTIMFFDKKKVTNTKEDFKDFYLSLKRNKK
jgi:hypothetical protein